MIVYSENNVVKWKNESHDFPFKWLPRESPVSPNTVAGDFFNNNTLERLPVKVEAIEWFPEDREIEEQTDFEIWEQCFQVSNNGIISLPYGLTDRVRFCLFSKKQTNID